MSRIDTITVDFSKAFDTVRCSDVVSDAQYRKERPYKVFKKTGKSRVDCHFQIYELSKIKEVRLEINHCRTSLDSLINILVNDKVLENGYGEAPRDNFETQQFDVPMNMCQEGLNIISVILSAESPGAYWISDIKIEMIYH